MLRAQSFERDRAGVWQSSPRRFEFRPKCNEGEDRQTPDALSQQIEQLDRGRVHPLGVLEHQQHGLAASQRFDLVEQHAERLPSQLQGAERERWISSRRIDRQEPRKQCKRRLTMRSRNCHRGFKFVEALFGSILFAETRHALEVCDERMQRSVASMPRALEEKTDELFLLGKTVGELSDDA